MASLSRHLVVDIEAMSNIADDPKWFSSDDGAAPENCEFSTVRRLL